MRCWSSTASQQHKRKKQTSSENEDKRRQRTTPATQHNARRGKAMTQYIRGRRPEATQPVDEQRRRLWRHVLKPHIFLSFATNDLRSKQTAQGVFVSDKPDASGKIATFVNIAFFSIAFKLKSRREHLSINRRKTNVRLFVRVWIRNRSYR
jgi:hypothetical protein